MVCSRTKIKIVDNSPIKRVRCVQVLRARKNWTAKVGTLLQTSVFELGTNPKKVMPKKLNLVLLVTSASKGHVKNGVSSKFDNSFGVVVDSNQQPFASKIVASLSKNLRKTGTRKLISNAPSFF